MTTIPAPVLVNELTCVECGYLLRGLDPAGRCPECNHAIAASIEAQAQHPARRALRSLKLGAVALLVAIIALPLAQTFAYWDNLPRPRSFFLNRDGVHHLIAGLLLLPAAWWLTRADRPDSSRFLPRARRLLALWLPLVVIVLAGLMFVLIHSRSRYANAILLPSYALAPLAQAVEVILLLGLLARGAWRIPRGPRSFWLRVPQCLYGGVLLLDATSSAIVNFARTLLLYDLFTPAKDRYLPESWDRVLQPIWKLTLPATGPLHLLTVVALLIFTVLLFRRTRFAPR